MNYKIKVSCIFSIIIAVIIIPARIQASPLPDCVNPQEVMSGTRLTSEKTNEYPGQQSTLKAAALHPVFHLDFNTCIPEIIWFNAGLFMTRDHQLFELSPQGLALKGTGRPFDPAFDDHGENRRCRDISTTAAICLDRETDHEIVSIKPHDPTMRRIPLIISGARRIKSFEFLPSPDAPSGLVSLMIDRHTGYDFLMFDVSHFPEQPGSGPESAP